MVPVLGNILVAAVTVALLIGTVRLKKHTTRRADR
jgi:hypothetical protein